MKDRGLAVEIPSRSGLTQADILMMVPFGKLSPSCSRVSTVCLFAFVVPDDTTPLKARRPERSPSVETVVPEDQVPDVVPVA
jgi:hypothetical protein